MLKHSVNFLTGFMLSLLFAAAAPAAPLQLSQVPLYLGGNIGPNVMFTLDDSGSMQWEVLPDEQLFVAGDPDGAVGTEIDYVFPENQAYYGSGYYSCGARNGGCSTATAAVGGHEDNNQHHYMTRSFHNNKAYYNPNIAYSPWRYADNTSYPNASITCAYHNPQNTALGCRDLTMQNNGAANTPLDSYGWWRRRLPSTGIYQWTLGPYVNAQLGTAGNPPLGTTGFWPAVYFTFKPSNAGCDGLATTRACYDKIEIRPPPTGTPIYAGGDKRTDCAANPTPATTCIYAQEIQNFANWYTYYRSRVLTARAGVGRAFAAQSNDPTSPSILRVGFGAINAAGATIDVQSSPGTVIKGVRKFTGTDRTNFFYDPVNPTNSLYGHSIPTSGTPLRKALDDVGKYFERTDSAGPWGETPGTASTTPQRACRQSYDILTTDGYWNGAAAPTTAAQANVDNTAGTSITNDALNPTPPNYTYTAVNPYKDNWGNPNPSGGTLADVAMYYWKRDLRTDLLNKVLPNAADPAFWQHMSTHTVGLGVSGTLNPAADLPALTAGTKTWPMPADSNAPPAGWQPGYNLDDLWHTALNGRGEFFSAADPVAFADSLSSILNAIVDRNSSAASVALNSGSITSGSHLYQAKFNTSNWSGQLLSIPINANGTIPLKADGTAAEDWDAAVILNAQDPNTRKIVTYKPSAPAGQHGIRFRWPAPPNPLYLPAGSSTLDPSYSPGASDLDKGQINALNTNPATGLLDVPSPKGTDRLDYLRGKAVSGFRTRTGKLGDSVYSSPAYVGAPQARYSNWRPGDPETGTYSGFKSSKSGRAPMVYLGANDGMLHAFNAGDGTERFAYVPASVFKNLNKLTDPAYNHRFYVDGSPIIGDAYFGGAWHTVLVGGLRGGGQGMYALDITDPPATTDTEAGIAAKVLWEFTDADDPTTSTKIEGDIDLGYTHSEPNIVRMQNGKWAAVFGNGYNNTEADGATTSSTTGNAVLYIVDIADGSLIAKLDTKEGSAQDPMGLASSRPNGLATAAPIDANGDYIVDYIYAGDLFGNMWKFDVTNTDKTQWKVAFGPTANPDPLFTACAGTSCTATNHQPITTRPQVGRHPTLPNGFLVFFGTGKYFESGDASPTGQTTQSFYGIWDKNAASLTAFGRNDLVPQVILKEVSGTFAGNSYELRVTTKKPVNWTSKSGWYMDLVNQGVPLDNKGEKQVTDSILRNDRIVFTTLIPSVDPCDFGGTGWLMEFDAATGGQLDFPPFDLNQDKTFNQADYVQQTITADFDGDGTVETRVVPPSGKKSKEGIIAQPGVVAGTGKDGDKEYKFSSGSTGNIERTVENAGPGFAGRTSWRELKQ